MTKTDLINLLAKDLGITKVQAGKSIDSILSGMKGALAKGEDVQLIGFGSFTAAKRAARTGRNPQTGQSIKIPAKTVPKFRAGKALKDALN